MWRKKKKKKKRNNPRDHARTTVASIKREMQKPRLTESVRNDGRDQVARVAENSNPPCGSAGSDDRPSALQRRREGISGVLLRSLAQHSLPVMLNPLRPVPVGAPTTLGGEDSVVQNHIEQ